MMIKSLLFPLVRANARVAEHTVRARAAVVARARAALVGRARQRVRRVDTHLRQVDDPGRGHKEQFFGY